ncbi:MAG TPA: helix-turn-helix transcriptional regulator [Candidatus Dormibacteraeota bacterium]|jgi:AraC family transcriptional regulator of arabinose operon|nr:helix-turn-helix transcriptional regulator [Candidatus Dormibacteraeota bacterium]
MPDDYRIRKVLQSVQGDPSKTVLELARLVNLSGSRLGHLFRVQVGTDLDSFLRDARLEKAAELLRQTELSIKEIAAKVGYHHSSSFARSFEKKFDVPPAEYRRRHRALMDHALSAPRRSVYH